MDLESIKRVYARHAGSYDNLFGAVASPGRRLAVEHLNQRPGRRILEVGVGTGLSLPLYRSDVRVVGIDISGEMLERARKRVARQNLRQVEDLIEMDAESLDFPDDSFDAVVAMYTASVVPNPTRMLDEMRRVCVNGGEMLIVNHFLSKGGIMEPVERALAPLSRHLGWRPDFEIESFLDPAQVEIEEVRKVPPMKMFTIVRCRNAPPASPGVAYTFESAEASDAATAGGSRA